MILRLRFSDNFVQDVLLPETHGKLKKVSIWYPRDSSYREYDGPDKWTGLWICNTGLFVEIVNKWQAWTLNTNGARAIRGKIRGEGILWIDGEECCKLQQRKRGEEVFVRKTKVKWPNVNSRGN